MNAKLGRGARAFPALAGAAVLTALAGGCEYPATPMARLTNPVTGDTVTCGPYRQYPGRDPVTATELERACIDRHLRRGYVRQP